MKKFLILFAAFALSLTLTGCNGEDNELPTLPDEIGMTEIDDYLGRPDVQYVDLRNFDDKMVSGYIAGFEFIPFFDYLEHEDILVRTDGDWTFAAEDIVSQVALETLFDNDKAIFLMCGSGTRAGFVKSALEEIGYDNVYNVGGISTYTADTDKLNYVPGDDSDYQLTVEMEGPYTPGVYYGFEPISQYMTTVVIGPRGAIAGVYFDAVYGGSTKQNMGDAYMLRSGFSWAVRADELASHIVANQGWGDIVFLETDLTGHNALTVPHHFLDIDLENSPDSVAGVSIGVEGFVLSWNLAIAQATTAGTVGLVDGVDQTLADWQAAHTPAFNYVDGVYTGYHEGYTALITIEGGQIVNVWFDAQHNGNSKQAYETNQYPMNLTFDAESGEWVEKDSTYGLKVSVMGVETTHASYATQVYTEGLAFENGKEYKITFDARAAEAREMKVMLGDALDADPWFTEYMAPWQVSLTPEMQTFSQVITMTEATTTDQGKFVFELGAIDGAAVNTDVYIENVKIEEYDSTFDNGDGTFGKVVGVNQVDMETFAGWFGDQWSGETTSELEILELVHLSWWNNAAVLAEAIIDAQEWSDEWAMYVDGSHERFSPDIDALAGVSIGVENWKVAVEEALAKATPAS